MAVKRWNGTAWEVYVGVSGATGPAGPTGPTGPVGPTGPAPSNVVSQSNGTVTTASTTSGVVRNIYTNTTDPTGGIDGDVWLKYV